MSPFASPLTPLKRCRTAAGATGTTPVSQKPFARREQLPLFGDEGQTFRMCSLPAAHYRKPIMGLVVGKNQIAPFYRLKSKAVGGGREPADELSFN